MSDTSKLSETDKAYFAGLVDVSGNVRVDRRYSGNTVVSRELVLSLHGLSEGQVTWIKARFKHPRVIRGTNTGTRTLYFVTRWAAQALAEVMNYIIAKEAETRLVFRFADSVAAKGKDKTPEQDRIRAEVDRELTALKRGV